MCCSIETSSDRVGHEWETKRTPFLCIRPVYAGALTICAALAILGVISLMGLYYPQSALGVVGTTLGYPGTYLILGCAVLVAVTIMIARCCYHYEATQREL